MNTRRLITATALAFIAAGSLAQEVSIDHAIGAGAAKSRAQVQSELQLARLDGTLRAWSDGYIEPLKRAKSRADVVAATLAARDSGELGAINAEVYHFNPAPALRLAASGR
jgi:hypothetical protein